ncbi:MAG: hypothetical protein ACREHD_00310 [Pirellulales bacterium]
MTRLFAFTTSLIVVGLLGWIAASAADDKKDDAKDKAKKRSAEQVSLAEQAVALGMEGFRASRIRLSDAQVERWSLRRIAALKAGGASHDDLHKARETHLDLMKKLEKLAESLYKSGQAAQIDYLEAKYARLEAERMLGDDEHDDTDGSDKKD